MKVGIMQPYFFPYLGYWQLINAVDVYVVYDDVNYIKGGWISRNNILLNGSKHLITIPLEGASSFKKINEIGITKDTIAKKKIIKTLELAYGKAPYYGAVIQIIKKLISENDNIALLNYNSIVEINKYLGISTKIYLSSQIEKNMSLKGQDKVIDINKRFGADIYYNAIGGQELYNADDFRQNGIQLCFLKMNSIKYMQFKKEFVPNLSIIDILMFNSIEDVNQMLHQYTLCGGVKQKLLP